MGLREYGDGGEESDDSKKKVFKEFDCPECDASNPYDEGFRAGDEVRCFYCGMSFKVHVDDNNKLKFKEV